VPSVRYSAQVGGNAAALPIPAPSPSMATGGACRVFGFPGTLVVPAPGPGLPQVAALARRGFYPSNAAHFIRPTKYLLAPPYPMHKPLGRTRDRISPVPAVNPGRVPKAVMRSPAGLRLRGQVMNNPRPMVLWPVLGRPGRFG